MTKRNPPDTTHRTHATACTSGAATFKPERPVRHRAVTDTQSASGDGRGELLDQAVGREERCQLGLGISATVGQGHEVL